MLAPALDPATAPPPEACCEDRNGRMLVGDPFLDPGRFPAPGLNAAVQIGILSPFYKNKIVGPVTVPGVGTSSISVPTATLPWTVSPEFKLGYTLPQGFGSFVLTYRFLVDEGSAILPVINLGTAAPVHSRLNVNVVDIDYQSREYGLGPRCDMRWTIGARIADNYFDSQAVTATVQERISNNHFAAGPHFGLELWRWLAQEPGYGLALYGKTEAAFTYGRVNQNFEQTVMGVGGANHLTVDPLANPGNAGSQWMPIMRVQAGLTWSPAWRKHNWRFSGGYEFEGWWWVGRLPGPQGAQESTGSEATLTTNGVFLRAEWKY
jgi:hypothetical protein